MPGLFHQYKNARTVQSTSDRLSLPHRTSAPRTSTSSDLHIGQSSRKQKNGKICKSDGVTQHDKLMKLGLRHIQFALGCVRTLVPSQRSPNRLILYHP